MYIKAFLVLIYFISVFSTYIYGTEKIHDNRPPNFQKDYKDVHIKSLGKQRILGEHLPIEFQLDNETYRLNLVPLERKVFAPNFPVWFIKSNTEDNPNYTYELIDEVNITGIDKSN